MKTPSHVAKFNMSEGAFVYDPDDSVINYDFASSDNKKKINIDREITNITQQRAIIHEIIHAAGGESFNDPDDWIAGFTTPDEDYYGHAVKSENLILEGLGDASHSRASFSGSSVDTAQL